MAWVVGASVWRRLLHQLCHLEDLGSVWRQLLSAQHAVRHQDGDDVSRSATINLSAAMASSLVTIFAFSISSAVRCVTSPNTKISSHSGPSTSHLFSRADFMAASSASLSL